jgi:hypothetical protein
MMRAVILAVVFVLTAACSALPTGLPPRSTIEPPSASAQAPASAAPVDDSTDVNGPPASRSSALASAPGLAATACPAGWGSQPKTAAGMGQAAITGVRVGRHACFDRIVIDVAGPVTGYTATYVPTVTADGSGNPVTVPGGARIQLVVRHPSNISATPGTSVANVAGFSTLRSVVAAGSFEGITTVGVGVRARLPMRVIVLKNPDRLILDVSAHW